MTASGGVFVGGVVAWWGEGRSRCGSWCWWGWGAVVGDYC